MSELEPTSVLFVCLGNICRSPTAHGVFKSVVAASGARPDSSRFLWDRVEAASEGLLREILSADTTR